MSTSSSAARTRHRDGRRRPLDLALEGILWSRSGPPASAAPRPRRSSSTGRSTTSSRCSSPGRAASPRRPAGRKDRHRPVINLADRKGNPRSTSQIGKDEGARLLTGGEARAAVDQGLLYRSDRLRRRKPGMRIAQEEIFGPTTALIPVRDSTRRYRVANAVAYGLSSSIFTRDVNRAFRAMRDLEAGITYVNAGTIGAEVHLPFGGTKNTGNGGREAGRPPSTCSPRGSRSTSTTPSVSRRRRSTPGRSRGRLPGLRSDPRPGDRHARGDRPSSGPSLRARAQGP